MRRVVAAALLLLATSAFGQQTSSVTIVATGPDGGPLASGEVRSRRSFTGEQYVRAGMTDANGRASFPLPAGTSDLIVIPAAGLGLAEDEALRIPIEEGVTVRFRVKRLVRISGRVTLEDRYHPQLSIYSIDSAWWRGVPFAEDGSFSVSVPAGVYSVQALRLFTTFGFGRANIDARNGDVANVVVTPRADGSPSIARPPLASRITVSAPGERGVSTVTGAPGAVDPLASVVVANQMTKQVAFTVSAADGSFSVPMYAPPGAAILIKHDPGGQYLPYLPFQGTINEIAIPQGTTVHVPLPETSGGGVAFGVGGALQQNVTGSLDTFARIGHPDSAQWWITGTMPSLRWSASQRIAINGTIEVRSRDFGASFDPSSISLSGGIDLERLFDPLGRELTANQQFMSSIMTPTGLPIELQGTIPTLQLRITNVRLAEPGLLRGDVVIDGMVPLNLPEGLYRPRIKVNAVNFRTTARHSDHFPSVESNAPSALPLVRVGAEGRQRMFWMLAANEFSNGSRGGVAEEDRGRFAFASHVMMSAQTLILPKEDARTGQPIRYRLEPFAPMIASSTARLAPAPAIPFRFPSGTLNVRIRRPDGFVEDLGTAPFVQSTSSTPTMRSGHSISGATNTVTDLFELRTLDPRFEHAFTQYGRHLVTMTGTIEDLYGNRYEGGGTYEVWVARTLDFETAVTPGTPFEVGDVFATGVTLQPPVPAEVQVRVRLLPGSDPARAIERVVERNANRFGYFQTDDLPIVMSAAGEYRVDITARYVDGDGVLWMGTATWGNVVETPNSPIVTRGRRGFDNVNAIQQQWFRVREARAGGDHVMYPFHRGDVMWMEKFDPAADIPKIAVQDTSGSFIPRLQARLRFGASIESPTREERIAAGEMPLFSTNSRFLSPAVDPDTTDHWGYFYAFAERPGIRVREFISEDSSNNGYWRFSDVYNFQQGNGANGDQPNDFKFQFGGAVWREADFAYYGAYASLFVLLPHNDPEGGRVMPPFQGNGGGPDGGPIMKLKGKDVDAFFHPTAVRAGTILERGQRVAFAGQLAPTLPGNVELLVRSPSGRERSLTARANKIGWWYRPSFDFDADEIGVWTARVKVTFDGSTSAGPLTVPLPTGNVLGSREGEFRFYVVELSSPPLDVTLDAAFDRGPGPLAKSAFLAPNAGPTVFRTALGANATMTMPGFILDERTIVETLTVDLAQLRVDFPNIDGADFTGANATDTITISLYANGRARQLIMLGEELIAMPQRVRAKRRGAAAR